MSKPAIFPIHGIQNFEGFPPTIIHAISSGEKSNADQIFEIEIQSSRSTEIVRIDLYLSEKFFNNDPPEHLVDRDKKNKKLNDCLKIREVVSQIQCACPACAALTMKK